MMENLLALLLQTEKEQDEKRRQEAEEAEKRQDGKRKQEAKERKREAGDIKALIHEQKKMQEHTTAELGLLRGDVGELRGEVNNQITRISDVEESMSNKIAEKKNLS